jgi:hypothetical protein
MPYPEIYPPDEESYHSTAVTHTMFVDAIDRAAALPSCPTGSWVSSMANQPEGLVSRRILVAGGGRLPLPTNRANTTWRLPEARVSAPCRHRPWR